MNLNEHESSRGAGRSRARGNSRGRSSSAGREKRGSTGKKEEATKLPAAQEAVQEEALLPEPLRQEAVRGTETAGETEDLILAL